MAANPTIASYRPSKISPQHRILPDAPPVGTRPSWLLLVVVTAAVTGLTWGIMQQRMPDIDPRHVGTSAVVGVSQP